MKHESESGKTFLSGPPSANQVTSYLTIKSERGGIFSITIIIYFK